MLAELSPREEKLLNIIKEKLDNQTSFQDKFKFNKLFNTEFDKQDKTIEKLAEYVGISGKTIERCKNTNVNVSKTIIIRLCIGMGSGVEPCKILLEEKGFILTNSFTDSFYTYLLSLKKPLSICECNNLIDAINKKYAGNPGFKKIRKFTDRTK